MKKPVLTLFLAGLLIFHSFVTSFADDEKKKVVVDDKKICITFDNLPAEQIYDETERYEITYEILSALDTHKVKAAGFVICESMESAWDIPARWLEAGHTLGVLTFSGQDITGVPVGAFIADIAKGTEALEGMLEGFNQKERYFRYPFLIYGTDKRSKKSVTDYLTEKKIKTAHASVTVEDFVYNLTMEKVYKSIDTMALVNLRNEYITHILDRLAGAEGMAKEFMGRPIRHILQLRINRLNAYFLDDILSILEDKGYRFISLESALKDKVYKTSDNYCGVNVVSFLERLKLAESEPCE